MHNLISGALADRTHGLRCRLFRVHRKSGGPASAIVPINKTSDGVAIKGYDPVAYFIDGKPVSGSGEFEYVWMGAKWHFASAENRDLFIRTLRSMRQIWRLLRVCSKCRNHG